MKVAFVRFTETEDFYEEDVEAGKLLEKQGTRVSYHLYNEQIAWQNFDLVNIKSCKCYDDEPQKFASWLEDCQRKNVRLMNPSDLALWNSDKLYLQELRKEGFTVSDTYWVGKGAKITLANALKESGFSKAVVKPSISAGGRQTFLVEGNPTENQEKEFRTILEHSAAMVQRFEPEVVSYGEVSLVFIRGNFSHGILKKPASGNFLIHEKFGGTADVFTPDKSIITQAGKLLEWIAEPLLYARVDGIIKNEKLVLMELEIIEPSLWTELVPGALQKYVDAMIALVEGKMPLRKSG